MTLVTEIRRGHLLRHTDLAGRGLEIGPYDQPTVLKSEADISYLDWKTREQLAAECSHPELAKNIPEIDYVVTSNNYRAYTSDQFDFIIANHVMEHVPNMIQWLIDINAMMKDGGVLFLALPDKNFSFDCYRPDTALSHFVAEFFLGVVDIPIEHLIEVEMYYDMEFIGEKMDISERLSWPRIQAAIARGPHVGIHSHVFRSSSILNKVLKPLFMMGLVPFHVVDFIPARGETGGEMLIVLRKGGDNVGVGTKEFYTQDRDDAKCCEEELVGLEARLQRMSSELEGLRQQSATAMQVHHRAREYCEGQLSTELATVITERDALSLRLDEAGATINALLSSNSWRLTSPLRQVARMLRRKRE